MGWFITVLYEYINQKPTGTYYLSLSLCATKKPTNQKTGGTFYLSSLSVRLKNPGGGDPFRRSMRTTLAASFAFVLAAGRSFPFCFSPSLS